MLISSIFRAEQERQLRGKLDSFFSENSIFFIFFYPLDKFSTLKLMLFLSGAGVPPYPCDVSLADGASLPRPQSPAVKPNGENGVKVQF